MLVVSYDPQSAWVREDDGKNHGEIDAAIAVTQMMLEAADLGLGTTYVGMFQSGEASCRLSGAAEGPGAHRPAASGLSGGWGPIPPGSTRTASPWRSW